jgi:hypothetical protein
VRPAWKEQQKSLWGEVRKETGRWKSRSKVRDLLADERCSRAVIDFLATTDVRRLVPAPFEEDAVEVSLSDVSSLKKWQGWTRLGSPGCVERLDFLFVVSAFSSRRTTPHMQTIITTFGS